MNIKVSKKKLRIFVFAIGILLILIGMAALGLSFRYRQIASASAPVAVEIPTRATLEESPELISGKPTRLIIDSIAVDLSVVEGNYNSETRSWTLSKDKAHFATVTSTPNNLSGNTYIYGHYRPEVFARLHKVSTDAEAIIETDNGHRFTYVYDSMVETVPGDITPLMPSTDSPKLLLQTCGGTFLQTRQIYSFSLKSVD